MAAKAVTNAGTNAHRGRGDESAATDADGRIDRPEFPRGGQGVRAQAPPVPHEQARGEFDCVTVPECGAECGAGASHAASEPSRTIVTTTARCARI